MDIKLTRRASLLASLGLLSGCAGFFKRSAFWGTVAAPFAKGPPAPFGRAEAEALPYASMAAWFEGAPRNLLVLGDASASGRLTWYSPTRQAITTNGPFVVQAIGLDIDLRSSTLADIGIPDLRALPGKTIRHQARFDADGSVDLTFRSTFRSEGEVDIDIYDRHYRLLDIREKVWSEGRQRYENRYWVDPATGYCWKSRQRIIPTSPDLHIEILKPYQT